MRDLYWLTDEQMIVWAPFFPKSHGKPRVDDYRVLSGIIFVNRNGLCWRDAFLRGIRSTQDATVLRSCSAGSRTGDGS
jgi:transposase